MSSASLTNHVKGYDMFGHVINLNFDKQGSSHTTPVGGCFSIFIKMAMLIYVGLNFKRMLFNESDTNFTQIGLINLEELGDVSYKETHLHLFFRVWKQIERKDLTTDDPEVGRHIKIQFNNQIVDWNKPQAQGRYTDRIFPSKVCELSDFGTNADAQEIYEAWNGFKILCPDISPSDDVFVRGDLGSMFSKNFRFELLRCSNDSLPAGVDACATDEEIDAYISDIQIDTWNMFEKINYKDYSGKPVYRVQDLIGSHTIRPGFSDLLVLYFRQHYVETQDEYLQLGQYTYQGYFYQIGKHLMRSTVTKADPKTVFASQAILLSEQIIHTRQIYGWLDLLGDLGGVTEVIMICFGFFLFPIAEHSFILRAIRKLYLVRTKHDTLFLKDAKAQTKEQEYLDLIKNESGSMRKEIAKHRHAKVRFIDSAKLYLANTFGCLFPGLMWREKKKFQKLYEMGQDRIEAELNIVKVIRALRNIKILMRNSLMSKKVKFEITHAGKNLINIDSSGDSSGDSSEGEMSPHGIDSGSPTKGKRHSDVTTDPNAILKNLKRSIVAKRKQSKLKGKAGKITYTKEEAGYILTTWAQNRLHRMYVLNQIKNPRVKKLVKDRSIFLLFGGFKKANLMKKSMTSRLNSEPRPGDFSYLSSSQQHGEVGEQSGALKVGAKLEQMLGTKYTKGLYSARNLQQSPSGPDEEMSNWMNNTINTIELQEQALSPKIPAPRASFVKTDYKSLKIRLANLGEVKKKKTQGH